MTDTDFQQTLQSLGFSQGEIKSYPPDSDGPLHTHDFDVMLLVLEGPFSLSKEDGVTTFESGQICELAAGVRHVEQTGPNGARVLLGKRNP